jgi:hypothetical protein
MGLGNWLRNHPRGLERIFPGTKWLFSRLDPVIQRMGYDRADLVLHLPEKLTKEIVFDCRMCGQCILHSTGMTCPMTCPKELRNGPCGGVQMDGRCEIDQIGRCVWVDAYERSRIMQRYGDDIADIQPPVNRRLQGSSAWINMLNQKDSRSPSGWDDIPKATNTPKDHR